MATFSEFLSVRQQTKKPSFDTSISTWLDRLLRPQYASVAVAKRLLEGAPEEIPEAIKKGLTGKEKGSYRQIAEEYGLPSPFWWGLAGDVGLDPLTYIPVGKVAQLGLRPLSKIPAIAKAGEALYKTKGIQALGKAVIPGFRPGEVPKEMWQKLLTAKQTAKNIEQLGTQEALEFSGKLQQEVKGLLKKGTIQQDDLGKIIASVEKGSIQFGLPDEVKPVWQKLDNYWKQIGERRKGIGKTLLSDDEYNYFLRQLSKSELEKLQRTGLDVGFKEFSTKTASDIARKYWKFTSLDETKIGGKIGKSVFIGKAKDLKVVPVNIQGISEEHLGEMFASTIKDLSDLQDIAKIYGIKIKFTPKYTTYGKALGLWQPKGRYLRVATGGKSQADFMSTVAHELAHVVHGEIGAMKSLFGRTVAFSQGVKKLVGHGKWNKIEKNIALLSDEVKEKIWKILGYSDDWIQKNYRYLTEPTEIFARYVQVVKKNPLLAKNVAPNLYNTIAPIFKRDDISRLFNNIFLTPQEYGKKFDIETIYKQLKTGKLFSATQPDWVELEKAVPGKFTADIPSLTFMGGRRMAKAEAGTSFFNTVKELELGSETPLEGWIKSTAPELKGLYFNPQIAKEIDTTRKAFTGEETFTEILKLYDNIQNFWKRWTLGVFPAYHFRNVVGNIWNNYLGGVINPDVYKQAAQIQLKVARNIPLDMKEKIIYELARKHGIMGKGIMRSEVPSLEIPSLTARTSGILNAPAVKGMEMGGHLEDNARLAHFIDKLAKKWSPQEAALSVKKYLFDYTNLTPFEQNVLKRLMPFYTWSRKNIPLQIEAIIQKTGKVLPIEKARQSLYRGAGEPPTELIPEWAKERMPVITGRKGKEVSYFPLESWLPYADISKISRPQEVFSELVSPLLKTPIELSTNRSWFFEAPIERYPGETREFLRVDLPARTAYVAQQLRLLNEINRILGYAKKAASAPPQPSMPQRITRLLTGIKTYKFDIEKAKRAKIWDLKKDIAALKIGLSRAKNYGREKEFKRISEKVIEFDKQIKDLK